MKEPKTKCKLCRKNMMGHYKKIPDSKWFKKHDTIHIKCADWLDDVFHEKCWKLTILNE